MYFWIYIHRYIYIYIYIYICVCVYILEWFLCMHVQTQVFFLTCKNMILHKGLPGTYLSLACLANTIEGNNISCSIIHQGKREREVGNNPLIYHSSLLVVVFKLSSNDYSG